MTWLRALDYDPYRLSCAWPSGAVQTLRNIEGNQVLPVTEAADR